MPRPTSEKPPLAYAGTDRRYELVELLGKGGMGTVFRAHDTRLGRDVAIKRIRIEQANGAGFQRFEREAQSVAILQHPNIVTLFDTARDGEGPFLVMEYVQGESLHNRLARLGAMEDAAAFAVFEGLCKGVSHAHAKGLIHRDIKPSNVILDRAGTAKLLDFGLARIREDLRRLRAAWARHLPAPAPACTPARATHAAPAPSTPPSLSIAFPVARNSAPGR